MFLEVKVVNGELVKLAASGTTPEIGAGMLGIVRAVYDNLNADGAKEEFKKNFTELLPLCFMEKEEIEDFLKDEVETHEEDVDKLIDKLDELKDLLKDLKGDSHNEAVS